MCRAHCWAGGWNGIGFAVSHLDRLQHRNHIGARVNVAVGGQQPRLVACETRVLATHGAARVLGDQIPAPQGIAPNRIGRRGRRGRRGGCPRARDTWTGATRTRAPVGASARVGERTLVAARCAYAALSSGEGAKLRGQAAAQVVAVEVPARGAPERDHGGTATNAEGGKCDARASPTRRHSPPPPNPYPATAWRRGCRGAVAHSDSSAVSSPSCEGKLPLRAL